MVGKRQFPKLITPEEAIALCPFNTLEELSRAHDLGATWKTLYSDDPKYDMVCKLAMIYTAGRIQGIREERAKRKQKGGTKYEL